MNKKKVFGTIAVRCFLLLFLGLHDVSTLRFLMTTIKLDLITSDIVMSIIVIYMVKG
ncbi:hypothetical protein [Pseudobacteroides cellulosolvens]|uniref:hypothetical protein n=1 Tax=Pseudobacteroides cellulosolvens TaxID=35825 RepID=UPI0012B5F2E2|nr:hypothetical protein [Pseudobacteroides cellulosolvens]